MRDNRESKNRERNRLGYGWKESKQATRLSFAGEELLNNVRAYVRGTEDIHRPVLHFKTMMSDK